LVRRFFYLPPDDDAGTSRKTVTANRLDAPAYQM